MAPSLLALTSIARYIKAAPATQRPRMSAAPPSHRNALAHGTHLHWYTVDSVLGQGAFGITYLATDNNLHRPVAIKEYLPGQLAHREQDGSVLALSDERLEEYEAGLKRFIFEARTLAKFEHPAVVRVHNIFEAHRTAYIVMQYEHGEGLDRLLKNRGTLTEREILQILHPLLGALEVIHGQGFVHRDIKPANIFVRSDGTPVLLDFGSAREAQGGEARTITNFVSPGYAPIEQYAGKSDQQGPWSDIYGLGATLYRAMTGRSPNDAVERSQALAQNIADSYQLGARHAKRSYSARLLAAVDHALAFRVQDRPPNIAAWRAELPPPVEAELDTADWDSATAPTLASDDSAPTLAVTLATSQAHAATPVNAEQGTRGRRPYTIGIVVLLVSAAVVGGWLARDQIDIHNGPEPISAAIPMAPAAPPTSSADAPQPTPSSSETPSASAEQLSVLLLSARKDLAAVRLMSPPGENAYEKFSQVLTEDPTNQAAQQGLAVISKRYLALAHREMAAGHLDQAQIYVGNAAKAAPDPVALNAARDTLAAHRLGLITPTAPTAPVARTAARSGAPIIEKSTRAAPRPR